MTNRELLHGPAMHHELLTQHQSQQNKVIWLFMHSDKLQERNLNNMQRCHIKYVNIYSHRTGVLLRNVLSQTTNQRSEQEWLSGWCPVTANSSRNEPRNFHAGGGNACKDTWSMSAVGTLRAADWLEIRSQENNWRAECECWELGRRAAVVIHVSVQQLCRLSDFFCWTYSNLCLHPDPKLPLRISHLV